MLRILRRWTLAALYLATAPMLLASGPGAEDRDAASTRSRDAVEDARRIGQDSDFNSTIRRESERALSAAGQASHAATPSLNTTALPNIPAETLAKAQQDITALLADPRLAAPERTSPKDNEPPPLVFVSFSMPDDSLRSLLMEAARTDSPLVLRGLVENSMERTVARLGELLGSGDSGETTDKPTPSIAIDPTLFDRFDVDNVPAFVLPLEVIASCTQAGCPITENLKVAGNVSLAYALGVMAREAGGTTLGNRAEQWRQRLEVRP